MPDETSQNREATAPSSVGGAEPSLAMGHAQNGQRIDKWLWYARVVKSRSIASTLVESGKVRVNKIRAIKPAYVVKCGDVLTITAHRKIRILKVLFPGRRRGPASEAQRLYEELTPVADVSDPGAASGGRVDANNAGASGSRTATRDAGAGRPTKRDRRRIDRLRGEGD